MAHTLFDNKLIEKKVEETLISKINAQGYMIVDSGLTAQDGTKINVHTYKVTGSLEALAEGEGNSGEFEVAYTNKEYEVLTLQGKFKYTDEQAMKDSFGIDQLLSGVTDEFMNDLNKRFFDELAKGTLKIEGSATAGVTFENVVDALALFKEKAKQRYLFVNPKQVAKIRKNFKDLLSYNEAYVRTGYVGTVAGVPVIMTNCVPDGEVYISSTEAVTLFMKKGIENEVNRNPDIRTTYNYTRKIFTVALTDERETVKITLV